MPNLLKRLLASLQIFFLVFTPKLLFPLATYAAITGTSGTSLVVPNVATATISLPSASGGADAVSTTSITAGALTGGVNETLATGSFQITGTSGSITSVTVGGVEILGSTVNFGADINATATAVANQISSHTSSPEYTASASTNTITITSVAGSGSTPNGLAVLATPSGGDMAVSNFTNMTGGVAEVKSNTTTSSFAAVTSQAGADLTLNIGGTLISLTGGNTGAQAAIAVTNQINADGASPYTAIIVNSDQVKLSAKATGASGDAALVATDLDYNTAAAIAAISTTNSLTAVTSQAGADLALNIDGVVITLTGGDSAAQAATAIASALTAGSTNFTGSVVNTDQVRLTRRTTGVSGNASVTANDLKYNTVAQVVDFAFGNITAGETSRITINSNNYSYLAGSGNSVQTVVEALAPLADADTAVACTEDDTKVTCTASAPGTAFTYAAVVEDVTAPSVFTTGSVVVTGGTVLSGKWNSTNTGVDITVPVANDPTLVGGTIQLQAEADGVFANLGSTYTILLGNLGNTVTLSRTAAQLEGITGFSAGDNITFRAVITDSNSASNTTTGNISGNSLDVDQAAPTVSSITTKDTNGDGRVETATIVFNEAVLDSSFAANNFTIAGSAATSITTGTLNDNAFDVIVSGGVTGTEAKDVTYIQGTGSDASGNLMANVVSGTVTEVDSANPVLLSTRTNSTTTIDLTFSEDLNGTTVTNADFSVAGHTLTTPDATEASAGVVRLTVSSAFGTGARPVVGYIGSVTDLSSNVGPNVASMTPTDGVAPVLSSVNLASDNTLLSTLFGKVGSNVILTFTSSETINTPTVSFTSGGATVSGSPTINSTSNDWTAFYVANSADTEGAVAYTINYSDTSGNTGTPVTTGSGSVTFDKTNPTSTGTPTTTSPTATNQTWTWTAGSDALSGVYQYVWSIVNNATSQTVSNGTTTSSTLQLVTNLAQGVWNLLVQTKDTAGNLSSTSSGQVTVDTTAPTVAANNASSNWQTTNPTITLSVSDSGGASLNSTRVRYNWDAVANATTGTVFTNGTQISVPGEGTYTLNLYAEDNAGNSNTFNGTYKVDTAAATASITAPSNNTFFNSLPSFTGTASDATSDVASVKFQYKASLAGTYTDLHTDTSSPYAADWSTTSLTTNTVYNLQTVTTDVAGNITTTSGISFTYDTTLPTITVTEPLASQTTDQNITVTATTDEIASCTYALDSASAVSLSTTGATSHTQALTLSTGTHSLVISCTDRAGNVQSLTRSFSVANVSGNTMSSTTADVSITSTTPGQADLPTGVTSVTLGNTTVLDFSTNLTTTASSKTVKLESGTNGQPVVIVNAGLVENNSVSIPDGATISGPTSWDGKFAPAVAATNAGNAPHALYSVNGSIVSIGSPNVTLTLDAPATIELQQSRGEAAYKPAGSNDWIRISNVCSGTYNNPGNPPAGSECYITNGISTKILTYHFTSFATLLFLGTGGDSARSSGPHYGIGGSPSSTTSSTSSSNGGSSASLAQGSGDGVLGETNENVVKVEEGGSGLEGDVDSKEEKVVNVKGFDISRPLAPENRTKTLAGAAAALLVGGAAYYYVRRRS